MTHANDVRHAGDDRLPDVEENPTAKRLDDLPPAARRALAEAEARRAMIDREQAAADKEIGGRGGKDPTRYGDWEVKGIAIDF